MTARRTPSTTSLARYAREPSPMLQDRSLDFCNSFWGIADGGVDVLFARMRGAARTMEELKNFWKDRATIEEEYAKKLGKLGKMVLGRDEIGDLRHSLDTVRSETDRQATFHLNLAQQIRTELEGPAAAFYSRQLQHRKTYQASIEKEFKTKQTQESYVNKAREKYEQDCLRINSFTAQASLVQGKDLDKINLKLERTQQTVQTNEREFAHFAKALQDTVQKWEQDWKRFCDSCQDLEEHRLEVMKDNLWAYANAVSTVCVTDDESCEKIRLALEQMEPEREMEGFVRDYGTGPQIPDPPAFVNYQAPDAIPSSSTRPTYRAANFLRLTNRESPIRTTTDEEPVVNTAGIGAGGSHRRGDSSGAEGGGDLSRRNTQAASSTPHSNHAPYTNGITSHQNAQTQQTVRPAASPATSTSSHSQARQSIVGQPPQHQQLQRVLQDPHAEPIDPTAETYIKVGSNAYKVDPTKDPQQGPPSSARQSLSAASPIKSTVGTEADPLVKQLEHLTNSVTNSGSSRRNTMIGRNGSTPDPKPSSTASPISSKATGWHSALSPPATANSASSNRSPSPVSPSRDYHNSADMIVGSHPSASRPVSPNPPTAVFMNPKSGQPGSEPVKEIISDYQQSLPGELKSISRSNSRSGSRSGHSNMSSIPPHEQQRQGQNLARPPSSIGHAGVGAYGGSRSNSPHPPLSRGPSPQPGQLVNRNSMQAPPQSGAGIARAPSPNAVGNSPHPSISRGPSPQPGQIVNRKSFMQAPPQSGAGIARAPSPNTVGIALDPSGRVMHDEMAHRYQHHQPPPHQPPPHQPPPHQPLQHQSSMHRSVPSHAQQAIYNSPPQAQQVGPATQQQRQRRQSYLASPTRTQSYGPVTPPPMSVPAAGMYHTTPSPQPSYIASGPPPVQPLYNAPPPQQQPVQYQQQQPQQNRYVQQLPPQQQQQQQQQAPALNQYGALNSDLHRASSMTYYDNRSPAQQIPPHPAQQQQPQILGIQQQQQQQQPMQQQQQRLGGYSTFQQHQPAHGQQQHLVEPVQAAQQVRRSPSPQPPQQTTEEGVPVLFYVRALYDYSATIEEEFDFQAGDILAVTSTPEDGWWTGELLDETRRQKGRNVFPSNFVTFF